jgi:DNA-binding transcriptional ArsR family regulator
VLEWIARLGVAGVDAMAAGLGISARRVHHHAAALEREGLVRRPRVGDGGGAVVAVTPSGVRESGREPRSHSTTGSLGGLIHGRGVSWIAAHCQRRERIWFGPGELRDEGWLVPLPAQRSRRRRLHAPDLGFLLEGERWAAEFERVPKARERLRSILGAYRSAQLAGELDSVLYVCGTASVERLVRLIADEVELNCVTRRFDRVLAEASGRST